MKITRGEHYFIRVMGEVWKVEVTGIVKTTDSSIISYKTESGTPLATDARYFKVMADNATMAEELNEIEV